MDFSQIGIVATSLSVAKDIAKAMVGVRDFNLVAEKSAAINEQLLKAQEALLSHNASMFELQNKYFEACEELRKLREAASKRGRYPLVDLGKGQLAYRVDVTPHQGGAGEPSAAQTPYYLCQPCYAQGMEVVLQRSFVMGVDNGLKCPACKTQVFD
jgi:hypothetical protein